MKSFAKHFRLTEADAVEYVLAKTDFFRPGSSPVCVEIGDGNINYVFRIRDREEGRSVVLKQADTLLRSSGRPLNVDRIRIEARALSLHGQFVPKLVPQVHLFDPVMSVIVMEDVSEYRNLRTELLQRKIFPSLARDLAEYMAVTLVSTTDFVLPPGGKKQLVKEFTNIELCEISEQLVFSDPFIDARGRNIVSSGNQALVEREIYGCAPLVLEAAELKRNFMNNAQALIHGDLHSGSIFVNSGGLKVLDPEFAFFGPMGYDLGNVIGNLFFPWVNAVFTETNPEKLESFTGWLSGTVSGIVELFRKRFLETARDSAADVMARVPGAMERLLNSVLADAAGCAGTEILRRTIGDSKVADITSVENPDVRIPMERVLIRAAAGLILGRRNFPAGEHFTSFFKEYLTKWRDAECGPHVL